MNQYFRMAALSLMLCAGGISIHAQNPADAVASVPALDAFHEVIFKIWHEAWPKKDIKLLQQLLPDVEKGITEVASAQLPGILREKKAAWEEGVKRLQSAGSEYKAAVAANDEQKMLAAAEELHSRFEALMRAIRPAMKELDDFHAVLYMLYHHYLPKHDVESIKSSSTELKQKMAALNTAQLPGRLKQKETEFLAAKAKLSKSVDALESFIRSNSEKAFRDAVELVHSNYQILEKILE
jgi:NADH dehydrogenase/NADH:ubiquinone oxidoreductase subunit G